MKNVELAPAKLSSWRKVALGTWHAPGDPSVYGKLEVKADLILERQKKFAKKTTITAIVARAIALTLEAHPNINGLVRFGKIYNRRDIQIFLQTAVDLEGNELSGVTINHANKKTVGAIMDELASKADLVRKDKDPAFKKAKQSFRLIPAFIMKRVLNAISFLMYTLNLDLSFLGLPKDPFGSVMITSVGMLGLEEAYAPLVPYSRVPMVIVVGSTKPKPHVDHQEIKIGHFFNLCVTFDHRMIDGVHASKMVQRVKYLLETEAGLTEVGL